MERKTIGEFIAVLRKANGLTQRQLAEKLNVSEKSISRWERNETSPDLALIPVIAELFSVTSDELLRGDRADTSAATVSPARQEKRIAYLFKQTLTRHQIHSIISAGIALCGSAPALLTSNFHVPFWAITTAVIALLIAVICQATATIRALSALDSEDFVAQTLYKARNTIIDRTFSLIYTYILWGEFLFFILYLGEGSTGYMMIVSSLALGLTLYIAFRAAMLKNGFLAPPTDE